MNSVTNSRRSQKSFEEIADLILSFEAAKPARVVIDGAKSGEVSYPWNDDAADWLTVVLATTQTASARLDGRDVIVVFP